MKAENGSGVYRQVFKDAHVNEKEKGKKADSEGQERLGGFKMGEVGRV